MKKVFLFAATLAMIYSCSRESNVVPKQQVLLPNSTELSAYDVLVHMTNSKGEEIYYAAEVGSDKRASYSYFIDSEDSTQAWRFAEYSETYDGTIYGSLDMTSPNTAVLTSSEQDSTVTISLVNIVESGDKITCQIEVGSEVVDCEIWNNTSDTLSFVSSGSIPFYSSSLGGVTAGLVNDGIMVISENASLAGQGNDCRHSMDRMAQLCREVGGKPHVKHSGLFHCCCSFDCY
ncbi:MAG: hypothetical protein IJ684_00275 [Bacteroidales bacterium]|nr:hypothetical protein [Bacteroidales bacterium]